MADEWRIGPDDWVIAVADTEGPQLVVAGPGTGKTEFLVRRAAHLLVTDALDPRSLLVLTFSRRGAADLRRRITDQLGRSTIPLPVSTFHSFAVRLLEAHTVDGSVPSLLTGPEQVALVASVLARSGDLDWPATHRSMLGSRTFAADVADFMMRMAERRIDADRLAELAAGRADWRALPEFRRRYLDELSTRDRIDYGTLLDRAVEVASTAAEDLADQYRYVLVDEYQDTSPAQADLLSAVTERRRALTVAGDPYQSIYGFRGADVGNIARFPERFRDLDGQPARRFVLATSFRVPAAILSAAERVSTGGELAGSAGPITPAPHVGSVDVHVFDQGSAEAEWIAAEVEALHYSERTPWSAMAVLVRSTRHLLPELSRALERRSIPHDRPDTRLVDHPAVRWVLDLAAAASAIGSDDPLVLAAAELPIRRILLSPLVGLGIAEERALRRDRIRASETWPQTLAAREPTAGVAGLLSDPSWAVDVPAVDGFWQLWDALPRLTALVLDPVRAGDRAALTAFAQALDQQAERDESISLDGYRRMADDDDFEATPLLAHRPGDGSRLTLTTLHQAKGLEFDVVFIADATDDVFPDLRRGLNPLDPHALGGPVDRATLLRDRLREETRLAYTAMTRARSRVVLTATTAGIDDDERRPSRFLLAAAAVDTVDDLVSPPSRRSDPLTAMGLQTLLRRSLADPAAPLADRLAAAATLAAAGPWEAASFAGVPERGPDDGVLGGRFRLSPSQAESYADCPRRYVFERRLAMTDSSSQWARFGSLVHTALERADRQALEDGRPTAAVADATAALDEVWADEADFGSPALDQWWRDEAQKTIDRLFAEWPADTVRTVAAERSLSMEIAGVQWVGRADRIEEVADGTLRVVDYKTSKSVMPVKKAEESLQLAFYVLATQADSEIEGPVGSAELWYPRTDAPGWRRSLAMDRLTELRETMEAITGAIGQEEWAPTPGDACQRCDVRIVCPEWPEGREAFVT